MPLYLTEHMDKRRLGRRRFFFFSAIFGLTSIATWFMADLLWRDGISALEVTLLAVFVIAFLTFFGVPFISTAPHKGAV